MARNYAQGKFAPQFPEKYIGKKTPTYRSGWELTFMQFCDNNPAIISWASESVVIPYRNPLTGKSTVYVPDFLIVYQDKNGQKKAELIEVKPAKQSTMEAAGNSIRNKAAVAVNFAKWAAATKWAKQQGISFRVVTEHDIYHKGAKK